MQDIATLEGKTIRDSQGPGHYPLDYEEARTYQHHHIDNHKWQ